MMQVTSGGTPAGGQTSGSGPGISSAPTAAAGDSGAEPPALRTARRTGLIDQVIEQLREQILAGTWPIGSRIPTEAELAQLTGTSRNTVREAVQSLVHAGLLERRQGSGTYVLAASELAGAVSRRVAGAHQHHVLEVRRALEAGAARLAAQRRTPQDVARMRELIAARNAAAERGDLAEVAANDFALHRAIGQAAHNPVLTDLYEHLLDAIYASILHNTMHGRAQDPNEHLGLIEAIWEQDEDRAASEVACDLGHVIAVTPQAEDEANPPG
ncbi:MAG TPA: FadR/GntR family transcriptional regulator [Kineosporiaceae bacterium]|nr:FadR/GntR family transcriptional regulator [Kineosporiaceae bacterium]